MQYQKNMAGRGEGCRGSMIRVMAEPTDPRMVKDHHQWDFAANPWSGSGTGEGGDELRDVRVAACCGSATQITSVRGFGLGWLPTQ